MALVPSLVLERGVCTLLSGKPSWKSEESPFMYLRLPSHCCLHTVCVWPSVHLVMQYTCVLSQAGWLSFKTPKFRELAWGNPSWSSQGRSCHTETDAYLSQKGSHTKAQG